MFLLFAGAAVLVWWGGRRLPDLAALVAARTKLGQAFVGMLLLGGITSLPELATASSAAAIGAGDLALNNAVGSAAFNVLLLAIADSALGRDALTSVVARPAILLQGVLGMLLLAAAAMAIQAGDLPVPLLGFGVGSALLFAFCIAAMWIASRYETRPAWQVVEGAGAPDTAEEEQDADDGRAVLPRLAGLAVLILIAGAVLAQSGEAIADRTGLGSGLVGFVLLAIATSLPELTVIVAAMRRGRYGLAVGDIFGANLFNVAMIFIIDVVDPGPPVLGAAGAFEASAALLALILTGIFLLGLLERRDRTVLRMGYDSLAALLVYVAGLAFLARMS